MSIDFKHSARHPARPVIAIRRPASDEQIVQALTMTVVNDPREAVRAYALLALQYGCLSGMRETRDWLEHIAGKSRDAGRRTWADSILFP